MARVGFWQLLLDDRVSVWERDAINGAYDAAGTATGMAWQANESAEKLAQRVSYMSREIVMLRSALTVLVNTLRETGVVDYQVLDARLQAAMEEVDPPPPPAPAPDAPPGERAFTCIRCRKAVKADKTIMLADGPVCEGGCK